MPIDFTGKLVVAIASRALFNLDESHSVFENEGVEAYARYQIEHEDDILEAGAAYPLVKKLLNLHLPNSTEPLVEVILLSRNSADTGLRIFNSIQHHQLNITRAAFTNGDNPYRYVQAFGAHLFLSAHPNDVREALKAGCAAATIFPNYNNTNLTSDQLRIAFDGDSVIFSDDSERIYQTQGLEAFAKNEQASAKDPLPAGPFKSFLQALHQLQTQYPPKQCPICTALVTARSAPSHERVIRTLRTWGIRLDQALFLGGLSKGQFLQGFAADFFFDDQWGHCESAASQNVAAGHVPHGVTNEK